MIPTPEEIRSIYAGIENRPGLVENLFGWNSETPIFDEVIGLNRPTVIIEVGTWNGRSAVHMAKCCRRRMIQTTIFAVDVFYGRAGDSIGEIPTTLIPRRWDTPSRYEQFLFNVKKQGFDDCIVPVCGFSSQGAAILKAHSVVADAIYIDGGHTEELVLEDLKSYWPLLRSGGRMFGDDLVGYGGVLMALGRFCKEMGVTIDIVGGQWLIVKP